MSMTTVASTSLLLTSLSGHTSAANGWKKKSHGQCNWLLLGLVTEHGYFLLFLHIVKIWSCCVCKNDKFMSGCPKSGSSRGITHGVSPWESLPRDDCARLHWLQWILLDLLELLDGKVLKAYASWKGLHKPLKNCFSPYYWCWQLRSQLGSVHQCFVWPEDVSHTFLHIPTALHTRNLLLQAAVTLPASPLVLGLNLVSRNHNELLQG